MFSIRVKLLKVEITNNYWPWKPTSTIWRREFNLNDVIYQTLIGIFLKNLNFKLIYNKDFISICCKIL